MDVQDRCDILWEMRLSGVAKQGYAVLYGKSQHNIVPGIPVFFHTDGNAMDMIPLLIL